MNVLVAGGTGFLGSNLIRALLREGEKVTVLTRRIPDAPMSGVRYDEWDGVSPERIVGHLRTADALVNLSGASIGAGRWTRARKRLLVDSRLITTGTLVAAMESASSRPSVFLNASAVGYYGDCGDDVVTESHLPGTGFLADLCLQWETAALQSRTLGVRVVLPRTGVVLAAEGGALARMALPFRLCVGGSLGSGRQWFPWIHIDDAVDAMVFALRREEVSGPMNVVAPGAVRMREFARALGNALGRPALMRVPGRLLTLALGEMADMVLASQHVLPQVLAEHNFRFEHSDLPSAFASIWPL